MQYPLSLPSIIGGSAIGRVTELGPDATSLRVGDLVVVDSFIRGRDNPTESILFGTHGGVSGNSRKLMDGEWRNSTYAEYAKAPLENCHFIEEPLLCQQLGYTEADIAYILRLLVPAGGLHELGIRAGETIIVAPASGAFVGTAVEIATAMGATVIAAARNTASLEKLARVGGGHAVKTVQLTCDAVADSKSLVQFGTVDAYLDFSPPAAAQSTHIVASLLALKPHGRACLMGGIQESVSLPYGLLMYRSLKLMGRFMYEREAIINLLRLISRRRLLLGEQAGLSCAGSFGLHEWDLAFDTAKKHAGWGVQVLFDPRKTVAT